MWNDQKDILRAFNAHGVEYLIVGGHAVSQHAEPRATKDLDVFIRSDAPNAERVFQALAEYGAPLAGLTAEDFRNHPEMTFQIGVDPVRIDLLQSIDGVDFETAWQRRVESTITTDAIPAHFISLEDLITNKLASKRLRDLADAEALRAAAAAREPETSE
jgi:predicted nucleotidyltransferase